MGRILGIERKDLIEKDLLLHQMLLDLSKDGFFAPNFLFKGGTCLIKSYCGYLRFSEDIDFTWRNQSEFQKKQKKELQANLSKATDETGSVFEDIAARRGLDFKYAKGNKSYVEFGGSKKMCTLKMWYDSELTKRRSFLKVQLNLVELLRFTPNKANLKSLLATNRSAELNALFPEYREYSEGISFDVYDIREILCEKVRAVLTRKGTKARDFLDVYLIHKQFGISPVDVEKHIIDKTNFTLDLYDKYNDNLKEKIKLLDSGKFFDWGQERGLLLSEIDDVEFYTFLKEFQEFLSNRIVHQLNLKPERSTKSS